MPTSRTHGPQLPTNPAVPSWISTEEQREAARKFCTTAIEHHYEERLKRWNAELDMLLVFAGLFSTALTAFIVQSYPLLQPDNTDTVVLALSYMSAQLESYSISQHDVNSTQKGPFIPASDAAFTAPNSAVWINGLWFSSLVCTLSASSIAVLVKQWLHQYSQSLSGTSPEVARLRQYRYDSMLKWHVPEIIAALPMLLQAALALFLSGLLILLWTLNSSVAIAATLAFGVLACFTVGTTLLPIFYPDCCYQSPQALTVFLLARTVARASSKVLRVVERLAHQAALETTSWTSRKYVALARLRDATRVLLARLGLMGSFSDWQTREKPDADARHTELEQSLALTAYYITLDNSMLNTTIIPCLSEMDALSARMSLRYADLLRDVTSKVATHEWKAWRPLMPFVLTILSLITCEPRKGAIRKVLQAMPRHPSCALKSRLGMLYLLAMSQLVKRRISAREAFHRILMYLQRTRIDTETSLAPGTSVLEDVEATFPLKPTEIEELVDLDRTESVSYYLTGIEYTVKYLLRHRARLERDGSPAAERVKNLFRGFMLFLHFPTWRTRRSRQGVLLWALRYSELPALIRKLREDPSTADLVEDDLVRMFREALVVIEEGYISNLDATGEAASRGSRRALAALQEGFNTVEVSTQTDRSFVLYEAGTAAGLHPPVQDDTQFVPADVVHDAGRTTTDASARHEEQSDRRHDHDQQTRAFSEEPPEGEAEILEPWTDLINDDGLAITIPELGSVFQSSDVPDSPLPDPDMWRLHLSTGRKRLRLGRTVSYHLPTELAVFERRPLPPVPETMVGEDLNSMLLLSEPEFDENGTPVPTRRRDIADKSISPATVPRLLPPRDLTEDPPTANGLSK